jgi:hypothetical protein
VLVSTKQWIAAMPWWAPFAACSKPAPFRTDAPQRFRTAHLPSLAG